MLLWLLAARLLSAAHADKEPELPGWPFGDPDYINRTATSMAPFLRAVSSLYCSRMALQGLTCRLQLPDQCILWNSSCQSGNRPEALDEFFNNNGTMSALVYNPWEYYAQHRNETGIPLDTNSMILSWMRDPDCRSSFFEWHTEHLDQPNWTYTNRVDNSDVSTTINWSAIATTSVPYGCCDACELIAGDVDVFYWPVPGANTDCVTLVGTTAASNIDQSLIIPDDSGIGGGWWNPQRDPYLLISTSSSSNPAPLQSLNARDYALLSAPPNSAESLVTAIQRGFTLLVRTHSVQRMILMVFLVLLPLFMLISLVCTLSIDVGQLVLSSHTLCFPLRLESFTRSNFPSGHVLVFLCRQPSLSILQTCHVLLKM